MFYNLISCINRYVEFSSLTNGQGDELNFLLFWKPLPLLPALNSHPLCRNHGLVPGKRNTQSISSLLLPTSHQKRYLSINYQSHAFLNLVATANLLIPGITHCAALMASQIMSSKSVVLLISS